MCFGEFLPMNTYSVEHLQKATSENNIKTSENFLTVFI